jgi:siroheme synthase-like protein
MSLLYPICLKLEGRRVLVVGGGKLARQKLAGLAPTGALVRVVAPPPAAPAEEALAEGFAPQRVQRVARTFRSEDLDGIALAFGATDDPTVNRQVVAAARARGIPANAVDDPEACDFHTPAVLRRHGLELAISTSGGFPGLSRAVREVLEAWLPPEHEDALAGLFALRRALLAGPLGPAERGRVLRELARRVATDYLQPAAAAAWAGPGATPHEAQAAHPAAQPQERA